MRKLVRLIGVIVLVTCGPSAAYAAADKTHMQIMAEIRMLQEQQQQLQQMLGNLADTLRSISTKIDDQSNVARKAFADQKLLIDGVAEATRILREKSDDTNVRLSSMTQELEAIRQTVTTIATRPAPPAAAPGTEPTPADPNAPPVTAPPVVAPPPGVSPQRMFQEAFSDYTRGDYDLAIEGFQTYIRMFPRTDQTDDAQLKIGDSHHGAGRYRDAITAFQKVIADYPQSDTVSAAYYKIGLSYEALKQPDLARKAYETVQKTHPNSPDAILAKQRLDALNRR